MKEWAVDNKEYAASGVLFQTVGYLKKLNEGQENVNIKELLHYIDETLSKEIESLETK